ncbi:MAG: GtrA family protein [bacterium]|nr:GtrA family protein [bacterium]
MPITRQQLVAEGWRLVRFFIIGFSAFLINTGLYALLSRWLWVSGNRTLENFLASVCAAVFGFLAHRAFTFRAKGSVARHAFRFVVVAVMSVILANILFWIGESVLHIFDFLVILIVSVLNPFFTYFMHRAYTFKQHESATPAQVVEDAML